MKFTFNFFFFLSALSFQLNALDEVSKMPFEFSAKKVDFLGGNLCLEGNVLLKSALINLSSNSAEIEFKEDNFNWSNSTLLLRDRVLARFKNDVEVTADLAKVFGNILIAQGEPSGFYKKVNFLRPIRLHKKLLELNICGKSLEAEIELEKSQQERLKRVSGENEIVATLENVFQIRGDSFNYIPVNEKDEKSFFNAYLEINSQSGGVFLSYQNGLNVKGTKACYDPSRNEISIIDPEGSFSLFTKDCDHNFFFSANSLRLNLETQVISLHGKVCLESLNFGELKVNGALAINFENASKKPTLVRAKGLINYHFGESSLALEGAAFCDANQNESLLIANEGGQIQYFRGDADFYANKAKFTFAKDSLKALPEKCLLEGDVKGIHKAAQNDEEGYKPIQFVLASAIEMNFLEGKIEMSAKKPARVLFYDKINKMQMSAEGLLLNMDKNHTFQFAKGKGDVRFRFVETELNEMKKKFNF